MKKTLIVTAIATVLITHICSAGHGSFYTEYGGAFQMKDTSLCPSGNVVQAIMQVNSTAVGPTNVAPYLGPGEIISTSPQKCDEMGTDPLYVYYFGDGNLGSYNYAQDSHMYGYIRAFSAKTIPESAYYGNSPCELCNTIATVDSDNPISNAVMITSVNPAYIFPGFDITTPDYITPDSDNTVTVEGTVPTAIADNNKLEPTEVTIYWENLTTGQNGSFSSGTGMWKNSNIQISYSPGVTNTICFHAEGISSIPGYPRSPYRCITFIPEPALISVILIALLGLARLRMS